MLKNHKRICLKLSILAATIATLPLSAHAAGLGKLTVMSALGQPLRAELEISASREEMSSLTAKIASVDAFRQANIDHVSALAGLRFTLDKHPGGEPYFKIHSDRPVNDPFLDFLIELNWSSGRLVREYTFLRDPPEAKSISSVAPAPSVVAPEIKTDAPVMHPAPRVEEQSAAPVAIESKKRAKSMASGDAAVSAAGSSDSEVSRAVKRGDTLGKIAAEVKPEGVSLDQMLVALFESNKTAFDGNNVNRLRAGKILSIPDAEAAKAVDPAEAHKIVRAHAVDFATYRTKLAEAATMATATPAETPRQEASGKIAPKIEDRTPQSSGKDKLQVSRTETAKSSKTAGALDEDLVSRDKALKEANSRIAELEKNLGDLKKLAELKSQSGADLQKQAQAAKQAPAVDVRPAATAPPVPPVAENPAVPASPPIALPPATQPPPAAVEAQVQTPAPSPQPQKKAAPPPPPPEPSFLDENMPYVAGGGGLLALLAAYFGLKAWKQKRSDADGPVSRSQATYSASDLSENSVFSASAGQRVDTGGAAIYDSDSSSSNADFARTTDSVDPLQEAEVYLAYGRDTQAEEILLDALETSPTRLAIHGKLLEIYAARHSAPQFATLAADVHRQTNGSGPEWEHALALGRVLDPTNTLFGGTVAGIVSATPAEEPTAVHSAPVESLAPVIVSAEPASEALDFDLDMGSPASPEPSAAPAVIATAISAEASGLDFDLGMDAPATETSAAGSGSKAALASDSNALDIDFDLTDIKTVTAPAVVASRPPDENAIDFDLGESSVVTDAAGLANQPLDFDFDIGDGAAKGAVDLSAINLDLDAPLPALAVSADNPEVTTKLELAQAYQEMGDHEGARGLLQEVIKEGSSAQQELARSKLAALG